MMGRWVAGPAVAIFCLAPCATLANMPAPVNARVEISAAVAGSSATLEAIERQAASLDRVRQQEIAALQARLTEAETRGVAEVAALQAELIAAREALVADLAERDSAYAQEIAVFRSEVTDIASTPEGAGALARYNAGDRVGAIAILDRLRQARDAGRRTRADIESAAEARQIAALALDALGKSDPAFDTSQVIARFEEVTRLDRNQFGDWYQLFSLYRAAGRNADALAAAERMEVLAGDDQSRSTAMVLGADILLSQGDRVGAMARYQRSLEIAERLSVADPGSAELAENVREALSKFEEILLSDENRGWGGFVSMRQGEVFDLPSYDTQSSPNKAREMSVSLIKIGDVLLSQGDREGALRRYERALMIREFLASTYPASADFARDESVAIAKIGDVFLSVGNRSGALARYHQSLVIAQRLSAADPGSADRARDVIVWELRVGDVSPSLDGALERYQNSLVIAERLLAADPASADAARDVSVSLNKVGDVLLRQGDQDGALTRYRRALEINERLSVSNASSVDRARDLSVSLTKIGDVRLDQGDRGEALTWYGRSLEIVERLAAADPVSADRARDVSVSLWKMGEATAERRYWERALAILQDLGARGALRPADQPFVAQLEQMLARTDQP